MGNGKYFYLGPKRKIKILVEECENWTAKDFTCLPNLADSGKRPTLVVIGT